MLDGMVQDAAARCLSLECYQRHALGEFRGRRLIGTVSQFYRNVVR